MNSNILFSLRNKQSRLFLNKASALKLDSERVLFLFRVSGIPFLVSEKGDIISARPYGGIQGVRWAGRCGERIERRRWRMKRDERVAAVKILSVRRKAARKFWAPQQDHRPLRVHDKRCGVKRNPPVTASPCQPPLGKGAKGTEEADCHSQCAHWLRNDREFYMGCGGCPGGRTGGVRPYGNVGTPA